MVAVSADAWTAVGTIALAVMTLAAVITTIVITVQDRRRADARLKAQLEHSDAQLQRERDLAREQEQESEAWAVQVLQAQWNAGPRTLAGDQPDDSARALVASVINQGSYTITRIEVQFSPGGQSLVSRSRTRYLPVTAPSWDSVPADSTGYSGALIRNAGMQFISDAIDAAHIADPFPVVRWTDRRGQRWEHRKGDVRKIDEGEPWSALARVSGLARS